MLIFYFFICMHIVLESFPVSSSGHLALLELISSTSLRSYYTGIANPYHLLHGVCALVVALFFKNRWWPFVSSWRRNWPQLMRIILYGIIADAITTSFFMLFRWYGTSWFPLGLGFALTAVMLASLYWCRRTNYTLYTWHHALVLGVVQGCALLPGISRFGLTYSVARWLRIPPYKAFEISFLIEWPLIVVASLTSVPLLFNPSLCAQFLNPMALLVILFAGASAWAGLNIVAFLIQKERLWLFAVYMILPIVLWLRYAYQ